MNVEGSEPAVICSQCGCAIECCEVCGDDPCPEPLCFGCLSLAVGHAAPQPHEHGG